jgi:hypothetical protein
MHFVSNAIWRVGCQHARLLIIFLHPPCFTDTFGLDDGEISDEREPPHNHREREIE